MDNKSTKWIKKCPGNLKMNRKSKNNQSITQKADQIIRHYQPLSYSNKEEVLDTLLTKIEKQETPVKKINPATRWNRVAGISAAATIAALIVLWFFTATTTISADKTNTSVYRLPDDSRVVLYNGGTVTFHKYYRPRSIKLSGIAYFEVEKGTGFRVKTSQGSVEVLGTRFLVDDREEKMKVQCFQGSVQTNFNKQSWILEPGTQFTGKNNSAQKEKMEGKSAYPDFAKFNKSFSNTPLTEVVKEIEDFFEVEIKLTIPPGKNFSGTIHSGNLENILQIVCKPMLLNYRIENQLTITIYNAN